MLGSTDADMSTETSETSISGRNPAMASDIAGLVEVSGIDASGRQPRSLTVPHCAHRCSGGAMSQPGSSDLDASQMQALVALDKFDGDVSESLPPSA